MGMIFSKSTTELENKIISIKKEIAKLNAVDIFNQNTQQKLIHIAQSITNLIQFAIQKSLLKDEYSANEEQNY